MIHAVFDPVGLFRGGRVHLVFYLVSSDGITPSDHIYFTGSVSTTTTTGLSSQTEREL